MAEPAPYRARNTMFFMVDRVIEQARRQPGWREFHHECGKYGLYFDDIEKIGREYSAVTVRAEQRRGLYLRFLVSRGRGRDPIAAILSAFDEAVSAGFPIDPKLRNILDPPAETEAEINFDELLGGSADEFEDILG